MSQGLAAALTEWIELQDLEAAAARQRLKSSFQVILAEQGGSLVIWPNWLRYRLRFPTVAKVGLHRLDMASVRHTYASRLITNGENLKHVQEQLGHASITIT